jgi:DeoR/GlpR family transcriptional regulator of sugar metabolism
MFLEERRHLIWQYLNKHERGTVNYFSACHGVSKETIRSDLFLMGGWYATAVRLFCGEVCNRN